MSEGLRRVNEAIVNNGLKRTGETVDRIRLAARALARAPAPGSWFARAYGSSRRELDSGTPDTLIYSISFPDGQTEQASKIMEVIIESGLCLGLSQMLRALPGFELTIVEFDPNPLIGVPLQGESGSHPILLESGGRARFDRDFVEFDFTPVEAQLLTKQKSSDRGPSYPPNWTKGKPRK